METLESCPVCGQRSFSNFLNVEDYTVSHREFTVQQCNQCYFLFTNPRPTESEIGAFYESQDYISHHDEAKNLISRVYTGVRDYTISQKVKLIHELSPGKGLLLDVGCGTGAFAQAAKADAWEVYGTEPDDGARNVAARRVGETVFSEIWTDELAGKKFDVITMWHVLEHVHRLNETLDWLRSHLTEKGSIIIAVPNPESADAQKYGRFWAAYDVPRHLYHFTKRTMDRLLVNHGLSVTRTLPMWFDSFYVSMLSTKYKRGNINYLESLKAGLQSNWQGRAGNHRPLNTSSLIYVINKK